MAIDDSPTATAMASMNSRPTKRCPNAPRSSASSSETELSRSGLWITATASKVTTLSAVTTGTVEGVHSEDRPEEDLLGRTGCSARGRIEVEEQCGEAGCRSEHDPRGQITAPHPLDPDQVHGAGSDHPAANESEREG